MMRILSMAVLGWILSGCVLPFQAFAQSGALERIARERTVVMGYLESAAPFSSVDANGRPQGYSVELCRAIALGIAEQLRLPDLKTRWVALTVQNRLEAVRAKRVDIECSTTTWTLSRQAAVDFSLITFVDGANILSFGESAASRLAELAGKRVAVMGGTTTEKVLREALARAQVKAEVLTIASRPQGVRMVEQGKAEGFASDRTTLLGAIAASPVRERFRLLDQDLSVEPYAFAIARDDHDFRLAVNRVIAGLYRGGGIKPIYERWLGPMGAPSILLTVSYYLQAIPE